MTDYFLDTEFECIAYAIDAMNLKEFERCRFMNCDFSACNFIGVTFINCVFLSCNFSGAKINHVALRTVHFEQCQIKDVNFSMCDKLIFEISFTDCTLDFTKFYGLRLKGTRFTNCSLIAVDFMGADVSEVDFDNCDLYRSEFGQANAMKANFKTSYHYTIDPVKTKVKNAIFSLPEAKGLLFKHDLLIK
jgi:uncharacterized protein YjbI with pentapeptide repeats